MSDDLRRKIALSQFERAKNVLDATFQEAYEDDENDGDALGSLPSFNGQSNRNRKYTGKTGSTTDRISSKEKSSLPTWSDFFDNKELVSLPDRDLDVNTYYTLPTSLLSNTTSIPIFIFHHGAGSSGLSFANLAKELNTKLEGRCGCFAFDARGHAETKFKKADAPICFDRDSFIKDFVSLLNYWFKSKISQEPLQKVSVILIGHSLGGSICTFAYPKLSTELQKKILGITMLDIVEEAAITALNKVEHFLQNTPNVFESINDAVDWHVQHALSRLRSSAEIAIPALFAPLKSGKVVRITNLKTFSPFWDTWFTDLSHSFVGLPVSKLLILAGNENLDKELIVGQMQGKYQLVVFQDSGHFIQEDSPIKTAITLIDFWKRNDSRNVVIKTNWGQHKTVQNT
ncbi:ANM_HP_G0075600.mRNA.1.CDS.1 [Saccharomyces cerevisiae]|nr:ANM_HP_G0138160.mRNA.1.CDS.1 [Saccharomyces cerevisiae]CAI5011282.1 ANM_HP_G0172260.mRNA.1.CDS.1 [Saccharomyces cerevisiae]CAI5029853.1 ANM_HP_G0189200.mRNA.1.CDS.1 [Saccharomyces cerevisiae]CAI5224206.1 ANM_HP_G0062400.mRNA.1.CDS.1 [Saccharomyces cerevisiae]CAI5225617.1 ANM_HP_G0075600.mRNA.1.CDS.1 [Saccharomyces cerevisiae]